MIKVIIDGREYEAEPGSTVLQVARARDIQIPTLCYHPALKPSGSCRLCAVEITSGTGKSLTMLSCIMKVKEGLEIRTQSEAVVKARVKAFRNLISMAPQAQSIRKLAKEHGIDLGHPADGCIRCRLCIRVCKEVVRAEALKMESRDGRSYVVPVEGRCIGCGTCANLCPTGSIQVEDRDSNRTVMIRDELIGSHSLERCEACGRLYATEKFLRHVAQRTAPHPDTREHHAYCPTCAKLFSGRVQSAYKFKRI